MYELLTADPLSMKECCIFNPILFSNLSFMMFSRNIIKFLRERERELIMAKNILTLLLEKTMIRRSGKATVAIFVSRHKMVSLQLEKNCHLHDKLLLKIYQAMPWLPFFHARRQQPLTSNPVLNKGVGINKIKIKT